MNEENRIEVNFTCMDCGETCNIYEEVDIGGGEIELWCYCKECDIETFHPLYKK